MAALKRPDLIARHLSTYGALLKEEAAKAGKNLAIKVAAGVAAFAALMLALGLTAIAVMLGLLHHFSWALVVVPGVTWLCVLVGAIVAMRPAVEPEVQVVRREMDRDLTILRMSQELKHERVI